jgi:hypothetical protein
MGLSSIFTAFFNDFTKSSSSSNLQSSKMENVPRSEEDLAIDAVLFLELRKCIVQDLDQHSANFRLIWPHYDPKPETINQIRLNLHTQIESLGEMLQVAQGCDEPYWTGWVSSGMRNGVEHY